MGRAKLSFGVADNFSLGDVKMQNVPIIGISTLQGNVDFVIFGTNILMQFLSTLNYGKNRMILSPRGNEKLREEHLAMLTGKETAVPFAMWGDHYQFARGTVGERANLNFFVDTGLVTMLPNGRGSVTQPGISASGDFWNNVGVKGSGNAYFSKLPIGLGGFTLDDTFVTTGRHGITTVAREIKIHALISHGWFKNVEGWTMDFDNMNYIFHN